MFNWFTKPAAAPVDDEPTSPERPASFFTTDCDEAFDVTPAERLVAFNERAIPRTVYDTHVVQDNSAQAGKFAMDSNGGEDTIKAIYAIDQVGIPEVQANWYGSQGFIGYQLCAIMAQHWFIDKACLVPARDAIRKGYKFTVNDGTEVAPEVLDAVTKANKRFKLNHNLVQFVKMGRVFGIRIAFCVIKNADPEFYVKPFNADSITPGSYKGITQIDPYWCVPELSQTGASDPSAIDFYEPEYWVIDGKRYHKTHLVIMRGPEVADILKPSYLYGGVSVPQRIYERVYASERTANEAPQLAMTKRAMIFYTDTAKAMGDIGRFLSRLRAWAGLRDNYGVKVADKDGDKIEQHDTSLADLDAVIMTQYQIACGAVNIPSTKMMGTTPKGFNSTGTYEEDSYHEELESIQVSDMEPLVDRHTLCLIRSEIAPKFSIAPFSLDCTWNPLDSLGEVEAATANKTKAETDKILVDMGAIDGQEVRARLSNDEQSGHNGLQTLEDGDAPETDTPNAQA